MGHNVQTASKESLFMVLDMLEAIGTKFWVEGGWGVDILIGKQKREHRDVDIDMDAAFVDLFLQKLLGIGYEIVADERPTRVELHHREHGYIDVHPLVIAPNGDARQANPEGGWFALQTEWFGSAVFEGRRVPCITVEGQRIYHSGYEPRAVDLLDMENLSAAYPEK